MRKNSLNLPLVGGLITVLGAASPALGLEEPKPPRNDLAEETPIEERVKAGREKISKQVDGSKGKKWDSPLVDLDQQDHAESVHEEKSPEVRHEEVKREIARSIAEAQKAYEERQKDQKDKKTAGKDSKKKPQILVGKSKDSFLLDLTNEKPRKKNEPAQSHVFDSRSAQSGEQRVFQIGGELDLLNTDQGKLITTGKLPGIVVAPNNPGAKATFKLEGQAKNRGFLEKLFGWNKEKERETLTTLASGKSGEMSTSNSHPTADLNASMKGVSLKKRLEMELDRKREESRAVDPGQEKYLPPATTVDLDRMQSPVGAIEGHPVTGFNEGQAEVPTEKQDGKIAKQPSVEEIHAALEAQFAKGIDSHDMVEREWAFRYAGTYRKFEAIPSLLQEIKARGVLAPLAVGVLGALDPAHREVEKVLFNCLNGGEPPMRQAAAAAFGRMGTESALRPLLQRLKIEKNYHVRKTLCTALGSLGLPGAVKDLRVQLESPGEVEEVKAQAALALAQLGDRSGKNYLLTALASSDPQLQILGISGLAMLNDPDLPGYLGQALDSPHEAIWIAAAEFFPCVGHAHALPLLRPRLLSPYLGTRRRAALALGMLGRDDGLPVLEECLREGTVGERRLAAGLFGMLGKREKAPQLIAALRDSHSSVRQAAAVALAYLGAKEALPALIEATRGTRQQLDLPPALRGAKADIHEQLVVLDAIRALRGEKYEVITFRTAPDAHSQRWPEYEKELFKRQVEVLKDFALVDVMVLEGHPVAAIVRDSASKEKLLKPGEGLTAGFVLRDLFPAQYEQRKLKQPAWVTFVRGDTKVTLAVGKPVEILFGRETKKELGMK